MYSIYVKREEFIDYLRANKIRVFNIHTAARISGKPEKYMSMRLSTMPHVRRATRGIYYLDDATIQEIVSNIVSPCYISLLSSFFIHGVTTQLPIEIQVMTSVQHKSVEVEGYSIRFIKLNQSRLFGYSKIDGSMVADLEKGIVDSLYLNTYSDETLDVIRNNLDLIDKGRLVKYGIRMQSRSTASRLGFAMERCGISASKLESMKSVRYVKLGAGGEMKDKKWRVSYAE